MMSSRPRILFLCTGNCCRSPMAEAILRHVAGEKFEALSAGSHPAGYVHPLAVAALAEMGIPAEGLRSKSWDELGDVPVDVVITVCDNAAREACPTFPGAPVRAHWPLPDPVQIFGADEEPERMAERVARTLRMRIEKLAEWSFGAMSREQLQAGLNMLGEG